MKNSILVLLISLAALNAGASICETEMKTFIRISEPRKARICQLFNSDDSFKMFHSCLINTAQSFDSTMTISRLRDLEEKDLSGVLMLCSGYSSTSSVQSGTTTRR